jgi:hypothetical protein
MADTDTGTDGAQTNDQAGSQSDKTENVSMTTPSKFK